MRRLALLLALFGVLQAAGSGASSGASPGMYIVVLKDSVSDPAAVAAEHGRADGAQVSHVYSYALKGYAAAIPESRVAAVRADPRVAAVAADSEVTAADVKPCTNVFSCQLRARWVTRVDADASSTRSGDGRGSVDVNVAVIDSGIDATHPDLNVKGGVNCISRFESFSDANGHGTAVAGVIGALDNDYGVVGVAPGASLWAARVLAANGVGTLADVICGIDWVTSTRLDADPANDIAVANISILSSGQDDATCSTTGEPLHLAICRMVGAGITTVVAAGNSSKDFNKTEPASFDEVLTATAISDSDGASGGLGPSATPCAPKVATGDDVAAFFSNFATAAADFAHTVAAPGVCIQSTYPDDSYVSESGTSFASPIVAGTVALCIASGPCAGLTPPQIVQKIVADAATYNTASKNFGYGFQGDPLRPVSGKYYGYLIRAGLY
jgi:subtilisin family serine protease